MSTSSSVMKVSFAAASSLLLASLDARAEQPGSAKETSYQAVRINLRDLIWNKVVEGFYERPLSDSLAFQGHLSVLFPRIADGAETSGFTLGGAVLWFPMNTARSLSGLSTELGAEAGSVSVSGSNYDVSGQLMSAYSNLVYTWTNKSDLSLSVGGGVGYSMLNIQTETSDSTGGVGLSGFGPRYVARLGYRF